MHGPRVSIAVLVTVLLLPSAATAGELERDIKSRWLGAWVVTTVDSYSDCSGPYTNNRINGELVKGYGAHRFFDGELARVDKVDAKRKRVDVHLSLVEPVLLPRPAGPFTLYDERSCRVEYEVTLPRDVIKSKDTAAIDAAMKLIVERYASEGEALASSRWNQRERDPYPDDYEQTLQAHAVWTAEQTNLGVQTQLDRAGAEAARVTDRMVGDAEYVADFAAGVESARDYRLSACPAMMAVNFEREFTPPTSTTKTEEGEEEPRVYGRGFDDGKRLVIALELMRRLPACFVPVPYQDEGELTAYQR